nr:lytic murein transglycosylase [Thiolinea sp.]
MRLLTITALAASVLASPLAQAECRNSMDFNHWVTSFRPQALAAGIRPAVYDQAMHSITPDNSVLKRDRSQKVFAQDFLTFAGKKVADYRLKTGSSQLKKQAGLFRRIEQQYGVPGPVLAAFWGLESDFGANTGSDSTLRSVATLAWDCRRPQLFQPEVIAALRLIQRGDQQVSSMKGAWAGELGQLQFLPSSYDKYAVDFDGNGKRDLIRSSADALASAANMLRQEGWRAGQPWLQEVRVPADMDWSLSGSRKLPIAQWVQQGVRSASGGALKGTGSAALLLPMGRKGPAFLAYPNFDVYLKWNESSVYSTTAAYFATRLAGAGPMRRGNGTVKPLSMDQVKQVQSRLRARGQRITKVDGIIGEETRTASQAAQQQLGLPADGYPDLEL